MHNEDQQTRYASSGLLHAVPDRGERVAAQPGSACARSLFLQAESDHLLLERSVGLDVAD
jgi:hypothetical protein